MKPHFLFFRTTASFFTPLLALSSLQGAVVNFNESNGTNAWTLPIGTNLLSGATAHTPSAPQQPDHGGTDQAGTTWSILTNNTVGTAANKMDSVTPNNGNSVIFPLNLSVNTKGYDITQFDSYAAWPDSGRDNQDFTVYYSTVTAPATFVQLAVVDNNTTTDLATHTRLTDSSGVLATGVHSFKFVFGIPNGQENGYAGYREFIALGTAVPVFDPLTWTGGSGAAGNANWITTADNNWKKTSDGTPANFNPLAPLTFDNTGGNRNINVSNPVTAGSLTFTNGISSDYTFGGQAITSSSAITAAGAGNVTFNSVFQSPGLTFSGTGTLTLNAANPALGGNLSVSAGTLNVGNNGAVSAATLTMSGGVARFPTASPTLGGLAGAGSSVILGNATTPATTHLTVGGTGATTFSGTISQAAGDVARITKTGSGSLALSGDNTYTGITTVAGGSLYFNQRLSLYHGLTASWTPANLIVNPGATLGFRIGSTGDFTESELMTMNLGGFATSSSLGIDTSVDYTFSRVLPPGIGLSKKGASIMTLATGNTHTGPTQVGGGTLKLANPSGPAVTGNVWIGDGSGDVFLNMGANNQFGANSVVTIANGTASANGKLQLRGTSQTIAGLSSPTGGISIVQNDETGTPGFTSAPGVAALTINAATNHSFRGIIRNQNGGALSLIKNGVGTQEFINVPVQANSHTGATTINGGALKLNFSGATTGWTSNVTVNTGATLQLDGVWNFTKTISGAGKVLKTGSGMVTQINQDGNATANNYSGGTVIQEGVLKFSSNGPSSGAGDGPNQTCPAGLMTPTNIITVKNGAAMGIGGTAALGNSGVMPQYAPTINIEPGGKLWGGDGSNLAFVANVNLDGANIEITNGSNAGSFNTNIALVGTLTVGGNSPSTISTSGTGSYATASLGSLGVPGTVFQVGNVTNSSAADLIVSSILMDVGNVPSPLTKTGTGMMILQGENTYTGETNVLAGTLAVKGNSIPDASKLIINGGKLDIATATSEAVDTLYFGTAKQPTGTYGSTASAATFKDDSRFSGTGILNVGNAIWTPPNAISWTPTSILTWNPASDRNAPYGVSQVPLAARFAPPGSANPALNSVLNVNSNARPNEGKVEALVGFSSSSSQGTRSTRFYAPTSWQYMDVLGYWAGAVASICMPPAHVVDAAHRNGVPILGNVFLAPTAYGGNIARVNEFLTKRPDGSFPVADKMILAAQYFKFDGWFINMETAGGNSATATAMQDFLKYCKAQAPTMQISWYDSMVSNGGVAWQRRLNSANQMFFQAGNNRVSDNIFLDFYWQGGNAITSSASLAQSLGRSPYDIYAGIDTEGAGDNGTNTWGGSTPIDWAQLFPPGQPHRASLGIYRPEWTFNYSGNQTDALNREIRYWSGQNSDPSNTSIPAGSGNPNWPGIANFIPAKSPLTTLPFVTNFNLGQGNRFMVEGVSKMNNQWTNLSLQDILPTWKWIVSSAGTKLTPSFDYDTAYYGGTSLKVAGTLTASQPNEIKLYQTSLPVDASTNLRLIYKPSAASAAQVQVGYAFEDAPTTMVYSSVGTSSTTNWTTLNTSLAGHAGKKIALITLKFSSSSTLANYAVNIGRLQIANSSTAPAPPSALTLEGKGRNPDEAFGNQLWLSWTPSPGPVLHYNVYYRPDLSASNDSKRVWLGATPGNYFFAPDVRRFALETSGYIQVEAVGPNMVASSSISTVQPTFTFESFPNLYHPVIASYPLASPLAIISSTTKADNVNAFDNSVLTTVEPGGHSGEWIGLDLGAGNARQLAAIRYVPRATLAGRMVNGFFQGSNTANFSSGVVELARVNFTPPENIETTLLVTDPTPCRYVRYVSPEYGYCNLAEFKLYATGDPVTETPPVNLQATVSGATATLTWSAPYVGMPFSYNLKRATTSGGPYTTIATGLATPSYQNTGIPSGSTYYYVVSTSNGDGESADSAQVVVNPPASLKLTGTVIGGGTPLNSGTSFSKAFDASLSTYFEATDATGWAGYDFGAGNGKSLIGVRYSPRNSDTSNPNNANSMLAGRFQASNTPDFSSDVVTFIALNTTPGYNSLTSIGVIPSTATYRYVRYVTSSVRTANISEIEFYGGKVPSAPTTLAASARDTTTTLSWATVSGATRYKVQRATTPGGTYETINSNVTALTFTDTGLVAGNTYYYKVAALNAIGEGPLSVEVSIFDSYSRWLLDNGQIPGNPNTSFDQDTDNDGIQNGAEYMNPGGIQDFPAAGITAVLKRDNLVTATLWQSPDLTLWTPASLVESPDQSGVAPGFHRVSGPVPPSSDTKTFYRLKFSR